MAKINIEFDGKIYSVDESTLAPLASPLERVLIHQLAGTGAVIRLGGTNYDVDANKLASARNVLTNRFSTGTIAGSDNKVIVNGTEYGLSKAKLQSATDKMNETLEGFLVFSKGLAYKLNEDCTSYSVVGIGDCTDEDVIIPAFYEGLPVTELKGLNVECSGGGEIWYDHYGTFANCKWITSVTIPEGVTSIDSNAFAQCSNLQHIIIPKTIMEVGYTAFAGCDSLQYNEYNNGRYLGNEENPHLLLTGIIDKTVTSFAISETTNCIACSAISNCGNLTDVTIGNSVISIGDSAFSSCYELASVIIPDSVINIGDYAFNSCNNLTSVTIGNNVTNIGCCAFSNCKVLTSVTIPDSVINIGDSAFSSCYKLTNVTIGNGVKSLGYGVFNSCSLENITISNNIESVETSGFRRGVIKYTEYNNGKYIGNSENPYVILVDVIDTSVTSFTIADTTKIIYDSVFDYYSNYNLNSITIPDSVTHIGKKAFFGCSNLTSVTIGNGVKKIDYQAFCRCHSLSGSIIIPDSVTSIGYEAFKHCDNLTSVTIGNGVTTIGNSAFAGCTGLTNVTIGNSVTSIGDSAFAGCTGLTNVIIPDSITSIGNSVFSNCSNFHYTEYDNGKYIGNNENPFVLLVEVVDKSVTNFTIPNTTKNIYNSAFSNCDNLTNVIIPDSITSIGDSAFANCTGLTNVIIGNSVINIGNSAFSKCTNLISLILSDSVTSIGEGAFSYCSNLMSVTIGKNVKTIGYSAFGNCSLVEVINKSLLDIVKGCTGFGRVAYYALEVHNNNSKLVDKDKYIFYTYDNTNYLIKYVGIDKTQLTLPEDYNGGNYKIREYAFDRCNNLTAIVIPNSVTSIENSAFSNCNALTSVTIGNGITSIGNNIFGGLYDLSIYINKPKGSIPGSPWVLWWGSGTIYWSDETEEYYIEAEA